MDLQIKISRSPLEVEGYFFPEIQFQAFPQKKRKKREVPPVKDIKLFFSPMDRENRFQVSVKVVSDLDEKAERFCYSFSLTAVGLFKWEEEVPSEEGARQEFEKQLAVTGASILYSGLRTMLHTITATGPYAPPCILPPVSFTPGMAEQAQEIESRVSSASSLRENKDEVEGT